MIRSPFIVLAAIVMFSPVALGDWVYKWTDRDGNVTYQELPPKGDFYRLETKEIEVLDTEPLTVPVESGQIGEQSRTSTDMNR